MGEMNKLFLVFLKKIGVGSGLSKNYSFFTKVINNNPISLYMTFRKTFQIAVELMFTAAFRQRFFPDNFNYNVIKSFKFIIAFFCQLKVFFELGCKSEAKHLNVFKRLIKRVIPFTRNLSACYISGFLHSRQSDGVIGQCSGFGITEFGANRTFPVNSYVESGISGFYGVHNSPLYLEYTAFQEKKQYCRLPNTFVKQALSCR